MQNAFNFGSLFAKIRGGTMAKRGPNNDRGSYVVACFLFIATAGRYGYPHVCLFVFPETISGSYIPDTSRYLKLNPFLLMRYAKIAPGA